jgi:cytochrome c oxidase assembly protein subunit 15
MEWSHRILGRLIGVVFIGPLAYFMLRKKLSISMGARLTGLAGLIGVQGLLGWYMVKSGLEDSLLDTPGAVPRVSQYRLAAHLGLAFVLYSGMFGTGMAAIKDWKFGHGGRWSGADGKSFDYILKNTQVKWFRRQSWALTALVFLTALSGKPHFTYILDNRYLFKQNSGAFVAGLDAGLVYNEFPLMGGRLAPPIDELFSPAFAKNADASDTWWRNFFENPTTVQFDHRVLVSPTVYSNDRESMSILYPQAFTTYLSSAILYAQTFRPSLRAVLPPLARVGATAVFAVANVQVLLGISTLIYLVPVPLAATHQAGSVALLSAMIHLLVTLRRPGIVARIWRKARVNK